MARTLVLLDHIPPWIERCLSDIDMRRFKSGFAWLEPSAELVFGTQVVAGREQIKLFFEKISRPLIVKHEIVEVWDGAPFMMLRGRLVLAKRLMPLDTVSPPLVAFLTLTPDLAIRQIAFVVGPLKALNGS